MIEVYVYYISSSRKEKKNRKGKSKIQLRIEKTNVVFLVLFFPRGVISVKGVQLQTSTYRSAASDGFSGIWSLRERIVAFGLLSTSNERQFFSLIVVYQAGRRRKRRKRRRGYAEGDTYMYLPPRKNETHRHTPTYVPRIIGLGRAGWLGPGQVHVPNEQRAAHKV